MTIREAKAAVHIQEWSLMVRQCQDSGLTVREWCRQNDIKPSCYYKRLSQVRKSVLEKSSLIPSYNNEPAVPTLVKVTSDDIAENQTSTSDTKPDSCFRLQYHSATLEIPVGSVAEDIAEVLKAMGQYAF